MSMSQSPCLPSDILELVISELSKSANGSIYTSSSTFSTLSRVSFWFRRLANKHRFCTISLRLRHLPLARVHRLLQVLQSNVWDEGEKPVVHVYTLSIQFSPQDDAHHGLEDGSLSTLLRIIFQRNIPIVPIRPFALHLLGHVPRRPSLFNILSSSDGKLDWNSLTASFVSDLREICADSRLTNLNLVRLRNVPLDLLSGPCVVESLMLDVVFFVPHSSSGSPESVHPYLGLREFNFYSSPSFVCLNCPSIFTNLKKLECRFKLTDDMDLLAKLLESTRSLNSLSLHMSSTTLLCMPTESPSRSKLSSLRCFSITLDTLPISAKYPQQTWCPQLINILRLGSDLALELLTITFRSSSIYVRQNLHEGIDQIMSHVDHKVFDAFLAGLPMVHKIIIELSFSVGVKQPMEDLDGLAEMAQLKAAECFQQTSRALLTNFAVEVSLQPLYLSSFAR